MRMLGGLALTSLVMQVSGAVTWPSSYDELEDIMLLNQGYNSRGLSLPVTPCDFPGSPGHVPAAGFVRTAFHDIASHDAQAGTNGLDASIAFELTGDNGRENPGPAFNNTLTFLSRFYSTEASMSDLIALSLYTAVRGCGGPVVPIRTGRKDATQHGALGVPAPFFTGDHFKQSFQRMGFSTEDMIKMVACGHTLGGVHPQQFPAVTGGDPSNGNPIAPPPTQNFDRSPTTFDNAIAVEFVDGTTQNPLVVGPANFSSDKVIFDVDGGNTIRELTDAQTFSDSCKDILQRMIDTVPSGVILTDPIEVYDVKPGSLSLTLSTDGSTILFTGEIRVRTTERPQSSIATVTLLYKDLTGVVGSIITTELAGTANGYDDSFSFYKFSAKLLSKTGIASFDVTITGTDGSTKVFDNNGKSFPIQDSIFVQMPECGLTASPNSYGMLSAEVVVAVRGTATSVVLNVNLQSARDVPFPLMTTSSIDCVQQSTIGDFTYYKGTFSLTPDQVASATFDIVSIVSGQSYTQAFQKLVGYGTPKGTITGPTTTKSSGPNYSNGTATTTATMTSTNPSSGVDAEFDTTIRGSPWAAWPATTKAAAPQRLCGPSEGCDANTWAYETVWQVSTPTDSMAFTVPAGSLPGSASPTWNTGYGQTQWASATDGWHIVAESTPSAMNDWHTVAGSTPSATDAWNTVAEPTPSGSKTIKAYTGGAVSLAHSAAGGSFAVIGVVVVMLL